MFDLIRDSTAGKFIRLISGRSFLLYPEEKPEWRWPTQYLNSTRYAPDQNDIQSNKIKSFPKEETHNTGTFSRTQTQTILVDWYDENDAENPQNWSLLKKLGVASLIK